MTMIDTEHKTNLKFELCIITEDVNKEEKNTVDFYINIEDLNNLINYIRINNINPQMICFNDLKISDETPDVIKQLYYTAYDIAFPKHLRDLMWTEGDFYDEAYYLSDTDDLDKLYAKYDMNTAYCDSDEEYYEKVIQNEKIMSAYDSRYQQSVECLKNKIIAKDVIKLNNVLCELI